MSSTPASRIQCVLRTDIPQGRDSIMRLNYLQLPFNDVRLRRAVLMAVNQEDY